MTSLEEKNRRLSEKLARLKRDIEVIRREKKAIAMETKAINLEMARVKAQRPSEIPTKPGQTSPVFQRMTRAQVRHCCKGPQVDDSFKRFVLAVPTAALKQ
jgi:hypothetical protein